MMTRCTALVLVLFAAAATFGGVSAAYAEGGCPPGQYPIGGPSGGWAGCAPIPQGGGRIAPQLPRADGRWLDTWGAISLSEAQAKFGASTGRMKKSEAMAEAQALCGENGATDCKKRTFTYKNQCVALIGTPPGVVGKTSIGTGPTIEEAIAVGRVSCDKQGVRCTVYHQDCTKPIYEKF